MIGELDFGHAATGRFENLRDAELGNEQTEGKPRRAGRRDVTARPDAPLDEPSKLKFAQRAVDRQAGRRERPNEFGFAGQPIAGSILPSGDRILQAIVNLPVLGRRFSQLRHDLIIQHLTDQIDQNPSCRVDKRGLDRTRTRRFGCGIHATGTSEMKVPFAHAGHPQTALRPEWIVHASLSRASAYAGAWGMTRAGARAGCRESGTPRGDSSR